MQMQMVEQKTAVDVVSSGRARNLRVVRAKEGGWFFAFDVPAPDQGPAQVFTLRTHHRNQRRTWVDPERLFNYLETVFGVKSLPTILDEADINEVL